jgi:hypothetical protein
VTPVGNGWTAVGSGSVMHQLSVGLPAPSAQLDADAAESITLLQCRPVGGAEEYDVDAYSYTSFASGASTNGVRLRWYGLEGCSDELDAVDVTEQSFVGGGWVHRYAHHLLSPIDAQSARVELEVLANGTATSVRFDKTYLPEPAADLLELAAIGALVARRRRAR